MKTINAIICGGLILAATASFADGPMDMSKGWTCKTNASSSSSDADKAADKKMSENPKSATEAFAMASSHCRDCTKITCEANQ